MTARTLMSATAVALATFAMLPVARAQTEAYPSRALRVVVPAGPGTSPDILMRSIALHLAPRLGQQVVVVNQPGGAGNIGHTTVAKSAPDGYTLLVTTDALSINDTLFPNQTMRSADFTPVIQAVGSPQVLVINARLPVNDVAGLIAYARANPGELNFGSPQPGKIAKLAIRWPQPRLLPQPKRRRPSA